MEKIYADGSRSEFREGGGASHDGGLAIARFQLLHAKAALEIYLKSDGRMQLTHDGHRLAIINVIEPLSGKTFHSVTKRGLRVSKAQCREALEMCYELIHAVETGAVVWEESNE
jgi:hypothetical protein